MNSTEKIPSNFKFQNLLKFLIIKGTCQMDLISNSFQTHFNYQTHLKIESITQNFKIILKLKLNLIIYVVEYLFKFLVKH
jgi:hypothetical protein